LRVLQVSTTDIKGGAAKAAFRLNEALNKLHIDSKMLVQDKYSDNLNVESISKTKIQKAMAIIRPICDDFFYQVYRKRKSDLFSTGKIGVNLAKNEIIKEADVINLHWINAGYLSLNSLKKLNKLNKPIVWTLHDMWAFTGGCHYSSQCRKYEKQCGCCPLLDSHHNKDLTRRIWKKKKHTFKTSNIQIVSPSNWIADIAKSSSLFCDFNVEVIPNYINEQVFKPLERGTARNILNIPLNKKIILFGSTHAAKDRRKGFSYFLEGINKLSQEYNSINKDIEILVFGATHLPELHKINFNIIFLGSLRDNFTLTLAYNAADIFVTTSLEDNLPLTVMEALACGVPVAAFNTGGISDLISHKENGYLIKHKSVENIAEGIFWLLSNEERLKKLGQNARNKVLNNYTLEIVGNRYKNVYEKLLA